MTAATEQQITDQGGTVHEFDYDKLGRQIHDRVTTRFRVWTERCGGSPPATKFAA
ncbi:MAG: hypothetical protein R3C59_23255 [Planctomycetaceae bacterium]